MRRRSFLAAIPAGLALSARAGARPPARGWAADARGLERFDEVMRGVMERHAMPGGSLCLAKDGRLVYAKGFGRARLDPPAPARPETMFGLASVSKAITAVAILKLVEERRLGLDDRAFAILRDLRPPGGGRVDPRTHAITVRMLLDHSAGYKQQPKPADVARRFHLRTAQLREDHLVRYFWHRPLDFDPGTEQHYSNFGYVVLGAIVERVVGGPYGPAIHRLVFGPMGIRRPRLGHGEPYGPDVAHRHGPDGRELPPIDIAGGSAGGWIASTVDLARFLAALDGARRPGFLAPATIEAMLAPPSPPLHRRQNGSWFGLGWDAVRETPRGPSYTKDGGAAGIRFAIGHMPGGVDWAVAFNGGRHAPGEPGEDADASRHIEDAIRQTAEWPEGEPFGPAAR